MVTDGLILRFYFLSLVGVNFDLNEIIFKIVSIISGYIARYDKIKSLVVRILTTNATL